MQRPRKSRNQANPQSDDEFPLQGSTDAKTVQPKPERDLAQSLLTYLFDDQNLVSQVWQHHKIIIRRDAFNQLQWLTSSMVEA